MQAVRQTPKHELVAACLCDGMRAGRWRGSLPGVEPLAADLDVSQHTVRRALRQLEAQGILTGGASGRCRGILVAGVADVMPPPLRVGILRHEPRLTDSPYTSLVLTDILHTLEAAGHIVCVCSKSQIELKLDVPRIARHLAETRADVWLVEVGSHPLLEWCTTQATPCLALFGRTDNLPLASTGVDKAPAFRAATRRLCALGHRRIVLIAREERRKPTPGLVERAFLDELAAHGIPTSDYRLPDWEETPEGFSRLLENLFRHTPPTALIIDETPRFLAAANFLARHRIHVPEQISLVSTDCDAALDWHHPPVAHMRWDSAHLVRRVLRWVTAVRHGKPDRKSIKCPAEFVPGGSIGPAVREK